jgi:hypothetical protein
MKRYNKKGRFSKENEGYFPTLPQLYVRLGLVYQAVDKLLDSTKAKFGKHSIHRANEKKDEGI